MMRWRGTAESVAYGAFSMRNGAVTVSNTAGLLSASIRSLMAKSRAGVRETAKRTPPSYRLRALIYIDGKNSLPQWSPQNRPMVVTPKPANENAVRASHNITLAGVIRQGFLTTKAGRGPGRSPVKEPGSLPAQNAGERSVLGRRLARAVA
jgi:hypothetical protein